MYLLMFYQNHSLIFSLSWPTCEHIHGAHILTQIFVCSSPTPAHVFADAELQVIVVAPCDEAFLFKNIL